MRWMINPDIYIFPYILLPLIQQIMHACLCSSMFMPWGAFGYPSEIIYAMNQRSVQQFLPVLFTYDRTHTHYQKLNNLSEIPMPFSLGNTKKTFMYTCHHMIPMIRWPLRLKISHSIIEMSQKNERFQFQNWFYLRVLLW